MQAVKRERDAVCKQVLQGQDDAQDQAVATSFTFLIAAAVGDSGVVFFAFTLPSLVMTGRHVFFYVL